MCDYYQIIGYKETNLTLQRKVDKTPVSTMESFNLKPRFDIFPPGDRNYSIYDWKHFGGRRKANAPLLYCSSDEEDLQRQNTEDMILASAESPDLKKRSLKCELIQGTVPIAN